MSKKFSEKTFVCHCFIHMRIRITAKTKFVGKIRTYFNTCRTLKATEVSHLVILLYTVIVVRRKIAPNCLFSNFAFIYCTKVPRLKTHTTSYIKTAILIYANIMLGLPVVSLRKVPIYVFSTYKVCVINFRIFFSGDENTHN